MKLQKCPVNGDLEKRLSDALYRVLGYESDFDAVLEAVLEVLDARDRIAQQAPPDYRCVMCDRPIPVGCKDCTEFALESVAAPQPNLKHAPGKWLPRESAGPEAR